MIINKSSYNQINILYAIIYFCWGIFFQIQNTVNTTWFTSKLLQYSVNIIALVILLFLNLLVVKYKDFHINYKDMGEFILFLVLGLLAGLHQFGFTFIVSFLFLYEARYINPKLILKTFLFFGGTVLLGTIILNKFGVISSYYFYLDRFRNSLGFRYSTFGSQILFYFICSYLVLRRNNVKYIELILLELANVFLYSNTNTKNPFILTSVFIGYVFILKIFHIRYLITRFKITKFIFSYSFIISFLVLIYITFFSSSDIFFKLNRELSGRLILNKNAFETWGITILGQKAEFITRGVNGLVIQNLHNYIDSAYFQNLIVNGTIFFVIIMFLFTRLAIIANRNKLEYLSMALFLIAIHAMFDPQLIWIWYSPFLLITGVNYKMLN